MSSEDFAHFADRSNTTGIVLQAHFLAMEEILRPWLLNRVRHIDFRDQMQASITNLSPLPQGAPPGLLDWPTNVCCLSKDPMTMDVIEPQVTWESHMLSPANAAFQKAVSDTNGVLLQGPDVPHQQESTSVKSYYWR